MSFKDENNLALDNAWKDYSYGIKKFDEQSLFISSGALALSLSFIKDIVPLKESYCVLLFYFSIVLFLSTIIVGFLGHIVSSNTNRKMYDMILERSEMKENDTDAIDSINSKIYYFQKKKSITISRMNVFTTYSLIAGLLLLVFYCIINISIYRNTQEDNQTNCIYLQSHNCK